MKTAILAAAAMMFAAPALAAEEAPKLGPDCLLALETITKSEIVKKGKTPSQADVLWSAAFSNDPIEALIAADLTPYDFMPPFFDALEISKTDPGCKGEEAGLDSYRDAAIEWAPKIMGAYAATMIGKMGADAFKQQDKK